jgi:hypothetical protein
VDGVRDDVPAGAEPASDEPVALVKKPAGLADGTGRTDEQVLDDQVEAAALTAEILEGVADNELDAQAAEAEVTPGEAEDLAISLDAHDLGVGIKSSDRTTHAASGQA